MAILRALLVVSYPLLIYAVLLTTVASGGHYLWTWLVIKQVEPLKEDDG